MKLLTTGLALLLAFSTVARSAETAAAETDCTARSLERRDLAPATLLACTRRLLGTPAQATNVSTDALYQGLSTLWWRSSADPAKADVETMHLVVHELEARHAMRPAEYRNQVDILLANGEFAEATIAKEAVGSRRSLVLPTLAPPATLPAGEARFWRWDAAANVLHEEGIDLRHGSHLVVTAATGCHFCNALADALPKDPPLARAFYDHATWIQRPDGNFGAKSMADWNTRHPAVRIETVFDKTGWPRPQPWSTPIFYFLKDGEVKAQVTGYEPARVEQLRQGFRAIGIDAGAP